MFGSWEHWIGVVNEFFWLVGAVVVTSIIVIDVFCLMERMLERRRNKKLPPVTVFTNLDDEDD